MMGVFVAVAEAESFAGAARRLQMSPPAVTRAVMLLEERLGARLLTRTTRIVRLTDVGARYFEDAKRILQEADEADEIAAGINASPRGLLSVTAPALFGKQYVMPIVTRYLSQHAQTTVSALFVDRVVNLVEEGFDVGIRIGELPDSSLRAIRVGRVGRVVVGTPGYLDSHGTPILPADLQGHTLIAATGISASPEWQFESSEGKAVVKLAARIRVNTNDGALEAVRRGFGLSRLLSYQVADELASGRLVRVLQDYEGAELPIHVIHREGRHGSAKVRAFVDMAVAMLRADEALK